MERGARVIGSVDNFDGQQNLEEWIQMVGRAAEFAGWTEEATFKAAMFRLRGEAGEHAEQLKAEGKIKTWKELQEALKDRFETAGKEQWHQYLLNTGTQGTKTVQEWAQAVRKLSLRALGPEMMVTKREEGEPPLNQEEERAEAARKKEARKGLLDYMRKTNFVRGLRSSLRQVVWRKKCQTFDEAVRTAAEEEAVEASHREEEVLSCYKGEVPEFATAGLVEKIVAALELREELKKTQTVAPQEIRTRATKSSRPTREGPCRKGATQQTDEEADDDDDDDEGAQDRARGAYRSPPAQRTSRMPFENAAGQRYAEQLPLPRQARGGGWSDRPQEWRRNAMPEGQYEARFQRYGPRDARDRCFTCGRPGHYARACPMNAAPRSGNGFRRLP